MIYWLNTCQRWNNFRSRSGSIRRSWR